MILQKAKDLVIDLITTSRVHADYKRVTDLADKYDIYITGEGIEKELIRIIRREDEELFKQRVAVTKSITPAIASSVRSPFNKVVRNDRVKKSFGNDPNNPDVRIAKMIKSFYGSDKKKNKGLDYWMKTRFLDLQFKDPNSWVVVEWDAVPITEVIKPRPYEITSRMARNWFIDNDDVKWLFVQEDIKFRGLAKPVKSQGDGQLSNPNNVPGVVMPALPAPQMDGCRFTLYDSDYTVVFEQIDRGYYEIAPGEEIVSIGKTEYVYRFAEPKIGFPPAYRIGYKRDDHTNGRTFVNPWHDAMCYFDKSLKTVSELDLTMTLHVFPQKIQYVQKCQGESKTKHCNRGRNNEGAVCGVCKGSGYKIHTTAQDAILLPMPDSKDDQLDLDKLLIYKAPPTDLIKFQNDYCQQLERQAHQAVYNSQVFVKSQTSGSGSNKSGAPIQTATEAEFNMQSVYDTLEPFTEKFSELWRDLITTFGLLAGLELDKINPVHEFPADFKLKTDDILLSERALASSSGASQFIIDSIEEDLAAIIYAGDDLALTKYRVKRRMFPFSGSTPDEIAVLVASQWVPEENKILYSNFDSIFKQLEREDPGFYNKKVPAEQDKAVAEKVKQIQETLKSQQPVITLDTFRSTNPNKQGGNNGGGNPTTDPNNDGTGNNNSGGN